MRAQHRDDEFSEYVAGHRESLRRLAYVICGDWHLAEDLVQISLAKLYVAWPKVEGDPGGYLRRILVNTHRDQLRRPFRRREALTLDHVADPAAPEAASPGHETDVLAAMRRLPPSMRHVLALRYFEDLSVADAAAALGCSEGNVKSQSARGLAHLERLLADRPTTEEARG